jgi:hypothetical protein
LSYSAHGNNLVLRTYSDRSLPIGNQRVYLDDHLAGKGGEAGAKTDRPAMYALSRLFDIDPADEYILSKGLRPTIEYFANGKAIPIETMISIGRNPGLDLILEDPRVSRQHAFIYADKEGRIFVLDNNSSNGVFVDGERIPSTTDFMHPHWYQVYESSAVRLGDVEGPILEITRQNSQLISSTSLDKRISDLRWRESVLQNGIIEPVPALGPGTYKGGMSCQVATVQTNGDCTEVLLSYATRRACQDRPVQEVDAYLFGIVPVSVLRFLVSTADVQTTVRLQELPGKPLFRELSTKLAQRDGVPSEEALMHFVQSCDHLHHEARERSHSVVDSHSAAQFIMQHPDLRARAEAEYENERLIGMLHEDEELNRKLARALVERAILGDIDESPANFVVDRTGTLKITDLDYAFPLSPLPVWIWGPQKGIMNRVLQSFSGKNICETVLRDIEEFIQLEDQAEVQRRLLDVGLRAEQITALFARARWFVENKQYPHFRTYNEVVKMVNQGAVSE